HSTGKSGCKFQQGVCEHGRAYPQRKALARLGNTPLHAPTAEQHGDAPLDAGAKALSFLKIGTLLVRFALGRPLPAALRDAYHFDTILLARFHILLTEEAPIRTIQLWGVPEALLVALQGRCHVLLVVRVSLEHFILRSEEHTSELQSHLNLVCRLLLEKKNLFAQ